MGDLLWKCYSFYENTDFQLALVHQPLERASIRKVMVIIGDSALDNTDEEMLLGVLTEKGLL